MAIVPTLSANIPEPDYNALLAEATKRFGIEYNPTLTALNQQSQVNNQAGTQQAGAVSQAYQQGLQSLANSFNQQKTGTGDLSAFYKSGAMNPVLTKIANDYGVDRNLMSVKQNQDLTNIANQMALYDKQIAEKQSQIQGFKPGFIGNTIQNLKDRSLEEGLNALKAQNEAKLATFNNQMNSDKFAEQKTSDLFDRSVNQQEFDLKKRAAASSGGGGGGGGGGGRSGGSSKSSGGMTKTELKALQKMQDGINEAADFIKAKFSSQKTTGKGSAAAVRNAFKEKYGLTLAEAGWRRIQVPIKDKKGKTVGKKWDWVQTGG